MLNFDIHRRLFAGSGQYLLTRDVFIILGSLLILFFLKVLSIDTQPYLRPIYYSRRKGKVAKSDFIDNTNSDLQWHQNYWTASLNAAYKKSVDLLSVSHGLCFNRYSSISGQRVPIEKKVQFLTEIIIGPTTKCGLASLSPVLKRLD